MMTTEPTSTTTGSSESLLELVIAATLEGIVEHDLIAGKVHYDDRWRLLLGFDPENAVSTDSDTWLELSHPADLPELKRLWEDHVQHGWPFQHTWRMRHRHGGYRWILCRSVLRFDDGGTPERAVSLFSDVTESVEANRRHQALVDAIPDTIMRLGCDGKVLDIRLSANRHEIGLVGKAKMDAHLAETCPTEFVEVVQGLVSIANSQSECVSSEWSYDEGGTPLYFELRVTAIDSEEAVCIVRDVTERKQLEGQLLQSRKLEAIGQLAAGVAHEINTPLQFIGDNTQFLKKAMERLVPLIGVYREVASQPMTDELAGRLKTAERRARPDFLIERCPRAIDAALDGVERVAGIVRSMKEFAHPGSDDPTQADINQALRSTVRVSANEWKHVAKIEFDLDEELPLINCYRGEVNQCFLNIVVNAAHALAEKFEDKPEGKIVIQTRAADEGVEVRISDNGPGISDSVQRRIFDPFFTTKPVGKGTGQGLSIARRSIVDKHGGELRCVSRLGEGTTFIIRLPLEQSQDEGCLPS